MTRESRQSRIMATELKTRADPGEPKVIEGYFAVFNKQTELFPGAFEEIAPGAFDDTIGGDIRALINHDATLVMGRTKANTLTLRVDEHGLFGTIIINEKDTDAMNQYERVQRGDVTQCSFGFEITEEDTEWRDDGTVKWTIRKVNLYEVSVCTFPAYEDTSVQARCREYRDMAKKQLEVRKNKAKERLKNGTESIDFKQKNSGEKN